MKKNITLFILFILFILWIFKSWFISSVISAGDLRVFYSSMFKDYFLYPYAWDWQQSNGLGGFSSSFGWFTLDISLPLFIGRIFHLNWSTIERVFYFFPFLILCIASSIALFKKLFQSNKFYLLAAFIYLLNTYILMMVGGGQIVGISLAYAIIPLVFRQFLILIEQQEKSKLLYQAILAGVLFALLIFFDLRFAYMLLAAVGFYFILLVRQNWKYVWSYFILSFGIAGLLHIFWILPVLLSHQNPAEALGGAYNSLASVTYFSFAKFENSISLLHPNWPENIFGKVYFMRPEFLLVPILAFLSLFFINKKDKCESKNVLFFALLGLLGAFLAKGANDPFGGVYVWMFAHMPGFVMFRDPSKWYTLVAISYSILIPFTVWKIYVWFESQPKFQISNYKIQIKSKNSVFNLQNLFVAIAVCYLLFLLKPAIIGQLTGTFKTIEIPTDYVKLENFLSHQSQFSRTFWIPTTQRYAFFSAEHPAVVAESYFSIYDINKLLHRMIQKNTEENLQNAGVKYVIVPYDPQREIFLKDRKYDNKQYLYTIAVLRKITWLREVHGFGAIAVFEIPSPKNHFWSSDSSLKISYSNINPSEYKVSLTNVKKGDLVVFSESFDTHWIARFESGSENSSIYDKQFNSFTLPKNGNYTMTVYYQPQKWENIGLVISLLALVLTAGSLIVLKKRK
jgi:hypothetical protein